MTDKELQKLRRPELLEIMLNLKSDLDKEKEENQKLKKQLNEKSIALDKSGNIAEAALELNGVFKAAQEAADVYLNNIKKMHSDQETIYNDTISKAKQEAADIIAQAQKEAYDLKNKTEIECRGKRAMTDDECSRKISETNIQCQNKIKEIKEKCTAISSLDSHIASFFNDSIIKEISEQEKNPV
ncbi:hypothetical protein [Porcipelethomonas sp.]|uniref:hypothetical protein n=1 Tax=Porcipelethomonas sp. TaxID=2981675 RepID=UPI003EF9B406